MHYDRWKRLGDPRAAVRAHDSATWRGEHKGYIRINVRPDHVAFPNATAHGQIYEHIAVMATVVGRPLRPGETVHHRNGVTMDNRPENLELWASNHPSGQRVEDLVAWARELLATYGEEFPRADVAA